MAELTTMPTNPNACQGEPTSGHAIAIELHHLQSPSVDIQTPSIYVRVAYADPTKHNRCSLLAIDNFNQGEDLMVRLRGLGVGSSRTVQFIMACKDACLMRRDAVWIVWVSLLSSGAHPDPEAQNGDAMVYIQRGECSKSLTHALHHPEQLRPARNFVLDNLEGVTGNSLYPSIGPRQALYVKKAFSKRAAVVSFCTALAVSVGLGVGIGFAKGDPRLGFAVGTGLLAVLAGIQCVLFWHISTASV